MTRGRVKARGAFTLVELLIAMAITLLLMAGLARSFAVIGTSIKEGRSQLTLSSKVRNLGFRLRTDLDALTVDARPPISSSAGKGYFMYYEGPLTEHTFGLYGAAPTRVTSAERELTPDPTVDSDNDSIPDFWDPTPQPGETNDGPTYRRHGRVGDFDDYLAFTAEARGEEWFTGKVPAYLIEDGLTGAAAMEPRIIRSKYAEIIIWASPSWQVDRSNNALRVADNFSAMPLYLDNDRDLVPDEVVLRQRVLLIRPDLNVERTIPTALPFTDKVLRPLNNVNAPAAVPPALSRIYPLDQTPVAGDWFPISTTTAPTQNQLMMRESWLVGMAPMHHFFDLSLRRVLHPETGEPTSFVAANSLEDLVQPHNRFAHVRYPGNKFGMANNATSMPLLALGWNDVVLNWLGTNDPRSEPPQAAPPAWFPVSHPSARTLTPDGSGPINGSGLFNGWLLPHFELGQPSAGGYVGEAPGQWHRGYLATTPGAPHPDPRWDRTGEDVVAANVLAFDLRGYDPTAPVFITSGPDGQPGRAGTDDDLSATADQTDLISVPNPPGPNLAQPLTELGTAGSDDVLVTVTDPGIYGLVTQDILNPAVPASFAVDLQAIASRGAFVDLMYPYLAGSPLRERTEQTLLSTAPPLTAAELTAVKNNYLQFFRSELSLYPPPPDNLGNPVTNNSMKQSGKLAFNSGGQLLWFQPTYDTWTDGYESDGFDQTQTENGEVSSTLFYGNRWVLNNVTGTTRVPRILDTAVPTRQRFQIDTGRYDPGRSETSPPIPIDLPAISITVRVQDPQTEEMTQFTLVEDLQ